jgi:Tfp pilus assembly protein FimT
MRVRGESGFSLVEILFVVGLIGVLCAIAVPTLGNAIGALRLSGDARSVSNGVAVAKMRAASAFTRVRMYVDLPTNAYHLEWLDTSVTPGHWTADGGTTYLSSAVTFSFGAVTAAPPNTQTTIAQAPLCTTDAGATIANTACIMFNSRGVPIDATSAPTPNDAFYVTDGTAVYGVTVAATGMMRVWHAPPVATPTWALN